MRCKFLLLKNILTVTYAHVLRVSEGRAEHSCFMYMNFVFVEPTDTDSLAFTLFLFSAVELVSHFTQEMDGSVYAGPSPTNMIFL